MTRVRFSLTRHNMNAHRQESYTAPGARSLLVSSAMHFARGKTHFGANECFWQNSCACSYASEEVNTAMAHARQATHTRALTPSTTSNFADLPGASVVGATPAWPAAGALTAPGLGASRAGGGATAAGDDDAGGSRVGAVAETPSCADARARRGGPTVNDGATIEGSVAAGRGAPAAAAPPALSCRRPVARARRP